jgi:hypothetical protein
MKLFNAILATISTVVILFLIVFKFYTMMWGKIVLAFAAAFLVSAVSKLLTAGSKN